MQDHTPVRQDILNYLEQDQAESLRRPKYNIRTVSPPKQTYANLMQQRSKALFATKKPKQPSVTPKLTVHDTQTPLATSWDPRTKIDSRNDNWSRSKSTSTSRVRLAPTSDCQCKADSDLKLHLTQWSAKQKQLITALT